MKKIISIILFLLFVGCATAPMLPPAVNITLNQPYDKVWSDAINIIAVENGLPIQTLAKDSGIITTDWVPYEKPITHYSTYEIIKTVGTIGTSRPPHFRYKFSINIKTIGDKTQLIIREHVERFVDDKWELSTGKLPPVVEKIINDFYVMESKK